MSFKTMDDGQVLLYAVSDIIFIEFLHLSCVINIHFAFQIILEHLNFCLNCVLYFILFLLHENHIVYTVADLE